MRLLLVAKTGWCGPLSKGVFIYCTGRTYWSFINLGTYRGVPLCYSSQRGVFGYIACHRHGFRSSSELCMGSGAVLTLNFILLLVLPLCKQLPLRLHRYMNDTKSRKHLLRCRFVVWVVYTGVVFSRHFSTSK